MFAAGHYTVIYTPNLQHLKNVLRWVPNSCLVCNYAGILLSNKTKTKTKATMKQKNKTLTFRDTWSNVIFIYVSGRRGEKA